MNIDEGIRNENCIYRMLAQLVEEIVVYFMLKATATITMETLIML
jgi:hypothetical protein